MSYDLDGFVIMECTVSTESGETWQRYTKGTASRLVRPCPHCGEHVTPDRKHFRGWEGAENEIDAGDAAGFHCPECGEKWTDEERHEANKRTRILHKGQTVKVGTDGAALIEGDLPKTRTLGFRWSAVDNPFRSSRFLGELEWNGARARDLEDAQKELDQFQYAIPWRDPEEEDETFDPYVAMRRIGRTPLGVVPLGHDLVTVGVDLRATQLHYVAIAWTPEATCRVIQYGILKVFSRKLGIERGLKTACRYLRDNIVAHGWMSEDGTKHEAGAVWIDAGWKPRHVYEFCNETDDLDQFEGVFMPYIGRGQSKQYGKAWTPQRKVGRNVSHIGDDFYFTWHRSTDPHLLVAVVNADAWKSYIHARLLQPVQDEDGEELAGAMTFHIPAAGDHADYTRQLGAEYPVRVFIPEKGETTVWKTISRVNHYFDATYAAAAAASYLGVRLEAIPAAPPSPPPGRDQGEEMTTPDGRPYYL